MSGSPVSATRSQWLLRRARRSEYVVTRGIWELYKIPYYYVDKSEGEARMGTGTKIDNLVRIGHGSTLCSRNIPASRTGLAGTTTIGNHATVTGQVGVAGHRKIGDRVVATR